MTIRLAVALLANEGLLRRERGRGKGVYVTPPPSVPEKSAPVLRRLCILPAAPTLRSDDPAIQQGVVQAVNAAETSLVLMPALSGAARREYLAHPRTAGSRPAAVFGGGRLFAGFPRAESSRRLHR